MQPVIVTEVEQFIFTKAKDLKAKHFAVSFLNQLQFDPETQDTASSVLLVYMKLFKAEIEKKSKDDQRTKFIRALLTGVGRVYPYAEKSKNKEVKERVKDLFRLMYSSDFGIVTKTVTLLVKMAKHGEEDVDGNISY